MVCTYVAELVDAIDGAAAFFDDALYRCYPSWPVISVRSNVDPGRTKIEELGSLEVGESNNSIQQ